MKAQDKIEFCKEVGQSLPGVKVYFRDGWDCFYFDLEGKYFAMMGVDEDAYITLKNDPDKNEELRQVYSDVIRPGYYTSKKHWNSIDLHAEEITSNMLEQLIKESYNLVFATLTKKVREAILAGQRKEYYV